jgi:hypothetical protein
MPTTDSQDLEGGSVLVGDWLAALIGAPEGEPLHPAER